MRSAVTLIGIMAVCCLPALALRASGTHLGTVGDTLLFGLGIISAAFLLTWAAEAAQVDVSQGLAVAAIALIAVLPEYAVDLAFAWKAGQDPEFAPFAVANMTGANRLLIGVGWSAVFLIFWLRTRGRVLRLTSAHSLDVIALGAATAYSFILPFKGSISLVDTVVMFAIFAVYVYGVARNEGEKPHLVGPASWIGHLAKRPRRTLNVAIFVFAAATILAAAEPFAEGLIHTGTQLGIDEFLLVQWLAPLASEAPEFLVAGILAFRGRAVMGMAALLSSKVNQWTLLLGGLPVAFSISGDTLGGLPLDGRQSEEVLLTAAQSLFAVAILISLSLSRWEAAALIGLFSIQFVIPNPEVRIAIAIVYLVLSAVLLVQQRRHIVTALRETRAILSRPAERL
ncbi:MAG: sodium:calcium antiporter [Chloroflexi bacterium]|nr:sodium:calcium antiporter [Chloroflexota bacterium]